VLAPGGLTEDDYLELAADCSAVYLPGSDYVPSSREETEDESRLGALEAGLAWDPIKVRADFAVIAVAWRRRLPLLGVCGGMQAMVVHAGGTLRPGRPAELRAHASRREPAPLTLAPGTLAAAVLDGDRAANSFHRQVVGRLPPALIVGARAEDGVVEAVEAPREYHPFWLGLQWHPELSGDRRPFAALSDAARSTAGA
jgi:putative glutamine amidotransferase